MKRILAIMAALVLIFSLAACGNSNDVETDGGNETPAATTPSESTPDESTPDESAPSVSDKTMGQTLLDSFNDIVASKPEATVEEIANELLTNEVIQFMSGAMPVEEGFLQGFSAESMSGFKSGAMFGPMMGSIAFIGYVFELEEDADIDAFMQTLEDNADPRWQLCVTADETVIEKNGNLVFFLMCDNANLVNNMQ